MRLKSSIKENLMRSVNMTDSKDGSDVNCNICLQAPFHTDIKACIKCMKWYCKQCLKKLKRTTSCAFCQDTPFVTRALTAKERETIRLAHTDGCPNAKCSLHQVKISYKDLLIHLEKECDYVPFKCVQGCRDELPNRGEEFLS